MSAADITDGPDIWNGIWPDGDGGRVYLCEASNEEGETVAYAEAESAKKALREVKQILAVDGSGMIRWPLTNTPKSQPSPFLGV